MFESITINNYRGLRRVNVESLSQINLFFGKNNCGKSSVLESIFLLTGQSNPVLPITTNSIRGISKVSEEMITLDFYEANPDNKILITATGSQYRELKIELIRSNSHDVVFSELDLNKSDSANLYYGVKLSYKLNGNDTIYNSGLIVTENNTGNAKVNIDKRYKEDLTSIYLASNNNQNSVTTARNLAKLIQNKQEGRILDVLRIIEPRIQDIQVVGDDILVDVGFVKRLPINVLGDGIRKILTIIVAISECSDGILIVDEMDNGLHFSVMPKLWEAIISSATKNNTQLFISTHNIDLLKGLVSVLDNNDSYRSKVSSYKLIKQDNDEIISLYYDYNNMKYVITQEIEMR